MSEVELSKAALRQEMRQRLRALTPEDRAVRSARIVEQLLALPVWRDARRVLLFAPLRTEPDLDLLWQSDTLAGKLCFFPRINGTELEPLAVSSLDELETGRWSLRQPPANAEHAGGDPLDVILVPGLAFTAEGKRLGRGGGHYDRLLARFPVARIGLAFAFQTIGDLPTQSHDLPVDQVITDQTTPAAGGP